jgi:hypothetical protein
MADELESVARLGLACWVGESEDPWDMRRVLGMIGDELYLVEIDGSNSDSFVRQHSQRPVSRVTTSCSCSCYRRPKLSGEIGVRIADLRGVHEQAVRRYFAAERQRVQGFLDNSWTPQFLRNMVGNTHIVELLTNAPRLDESRRGQIAKTMRLYVSDEKQAKDATEAVLKLVESNRASEPEQIRATLQHSLTDPKQATAAATHIAALLGTEEPAQLMIEWVQDAQAEIHKKEREVLAPLDEAERMVLADLTESYAQLQAAQALLTARLEAAAELTEEQDKVIEDLGAEKMFSAVKQELTKVSAAVGSALSEADGMLDSKAAAKVLGDKLRDELKKILDERPKPTETKEDDNQKTKGN